MPRVEFKFTDRSAEFLTALRSAQEDALYAGAVVLENAVKRGLRGGYTSGDFTMGIAWNSIAIGEAEFDGTGRGTIRIGTPLLYPLFWEIGHNNIFTRRFERVLVWEPAYMETRETAVDAYERVLRARLLTSAARGLVA